MSRTRKSFEGFRRRYVGDLRHLLRCCQAGRLPPANIPYLEDILLDADWLPKPREVAERVQFTYEQQQTNHIYTIPVIDKSAEELVELRKAKVRARKKLKRGRDRAAYRAAVASQKPWIAAGMTERTWYRHRAKAAAANGAGFVQTVVRTNPLPSQTQVADGAYPRISFKQRRTVCHAERSSPKGSLDRTSPSTLAPLVANCVGRNAERWPKYKKEKESKQVGADIVKNPEAPVDPRPPSMNASSNPKPSRTSQP